MVAFPDLAFSTGSACMSARVEPSYVLRALGLDDDSAHGSVRFSFGRFTTAQEIDYAVERIREAVAELRSLSSTWHRACEPDQRAPDRPEGAFASHARRCRHDGWHSRSSRSSWSQSLPAPCSIWGKRTGCSGSKARNAYREYQREHEDDVLARGVAFPFVKRLLSFNRSPDDSPVEVVLLSRNDPDTGLRVFNSIESYGLDITRAAFLSGSAPFRYIPDFNASVFLSANAHNV